MPDLRASDADRDACVADLRHHAAAGRLDVDELGERIEQALAAKTVRQLGELQADLPASAAAAPPAPPAPTPARRPPRVPGRLGFNARWHAPTDARDTMLELLAHVVPPLQRHGFRLVHHSPHHLHLRHELRPVWTIAVAVLMFPIGLVALLHKVSDEVSIDLHESHDGTWVLASGLAPLAVRRAFADLEG